jgi:DNA invertase Pin-like site-specific DNA recombinase
VRANTGSTPKARHRVTPADVKQILKLYEGGKSIRTVMAELDYGYGTVHRVLKDNNALRPRSNWRNFKRAE